MTNSINWLIVIIASSGVVLAFFCCSLYYIAGFSIFTPNVIFAFLLISTAVHFEHRCVLQIFSFHFGINAMINWNCVSGFIFLQSNSGIPVHYFRSIQWKHPQKYLLLFYYIEICRSGKFMVMFIYKKVYFAAQHVL